MLADLTIHQHKLWSSSAKAILLVCALSLPVQMARDSVHMHQQLPDTLLEQVRWLHEHTVCMGFRKLLRLNQNKIPVASGRSLGCNPI